MSSDCTCINPLDEERKPANKVAEPCIMVIFGATGDLTGRKLLPALYNLARENLLPTDFACVGFARRPKTNEQFRDEMFKDVSTYSRTKIAEENLWDTFSQKIFYHQSEFDQDEGYEKLNSFLQDLDKQFGTKGNRVFYLSTQPSFFPLIIQKLHQHQLIYDNNKATDKWSRVIIEKPFGRDLDSAISLQKEISQYLDESQIYRIDHYLGKETVQNLLIFRFCNPIFEYNWNNHYIDNIQITVSEDLGIGTRGRFFEEAGMLRDIVQNHMMQLLSLVAMEPPMNLQADSIHSEKLKVMESIRPFPKVDFDRSILRGQYGPGTINGTAVPGYRQEENVAPDSNIETYVALELFIDNWRWAGVPFYLRAGKRLPKRSTEIVITFKNAPGCLFKMTGRKIEENVLIIRIQPDEGISLKMNCKVPGLNTQVQPVNMDFRYGSYFGSTPPEAYERLLCDCISGDNTLFARANEVIASWRLFTPILEAWEKTKPANFPNYAAGSWGPADADKMITGDGKQWKKI